MNESNSKLMTAVTTLRQLFGENRAEQLPSEQFKDLFVAPTYLQKLESIRPCFLVGGRGTGKTTSLQSLKYEATLERLESHNLTFADQEYLGILVRMNKNRVRAFQGGGKDSDEWKKVFSHYINLLICLELSNLGIWLESRSDKKASNCSVNQIAIDLGLDEATDFQGLRAKIKSGISTLQLYVNNPNSISEITLSMAESPVRVFVETLQETGLSEERLIFCCIDEYENLLDEQQAVINTYIKHAEPPLSYKVGVRKNGLKNRQTLDGYDLLKNPDDYAEIEIADEGFEYFAQAVAELRLRSASDRGVSVPLKLNDFLLGMSFSEEAEKLGAKKVASEILDELKKEDAELYEEFSNKPACDIYFLKYWKEGYGSSLIDLANDWKINERTWRTRIGNHGYASLFWLSRGKGVRIRKYYCGEGVFLALSAGNIRYFLELIDVAIGHESDFSFSSQKEEIKELTISPKSQTLAVRDVGKRRLDQLEGLADHGVQLKRLVLAIGKVFFEFARSPAGKTPEVNSFVVNGSQQELERIGELLSEGVGHLAFEVFPRTKATTSLEMKDDDEYRIHRIFSGFFEISHRKKRRTVFEAKDLLAILDDKPSKIISSILGRNPQTNEDNLPEQLAFFNAFYDQEAKK